MTASLLAPAVPLYQIVLFPAAKSSAMLLDKWPDPENMQFFRKKDFLELLKIHMTSEGTDIRRIAAKGALNFLYLDDLPAMEKGETQCIKTTHGES